MEGLTNDEIAERLDCSTLLGGALLGQEKCADAEPLLVQGYQGMKSREAKMPDAARMHLAQALERLVQLYDAWGKSDQAEPWRKKLELHKRGSAR